MAMSKLFAGPEFRLAPHAACYGKLQAPTETRRNWKKHKLEKEKEGCASELPNLFLPQRGLETHYHGEFATL